MGDHQPQPDEQDAVDDVFTDEDLAASSEEKTVPLAEVVKHRQEAARLRDELEQMRTKMTDTSTAPKSEVVPPQAPSSDPVHDRLERLERQTQLRELMDQNGLSAKQADVVSDLMREKGLDAGEAKTLAAHRDPDTFAVEGPSAGFDAGTHGSARPTPGAMPTKPDRDTENPEDRLAYIQQMQKGGNKKEAQRYLNNLVGSIAAQQVGRPGHQRLKIPKT